jgi:hypothetical protein
MAGGVRVAADAGFEMGRKNLGGHVSQYGQAETPVVKGYDVRSPLFRPGSDR